VTKIYILPWKRYAIVCLSAMKEAACPGDIPPETRVNTGFLLVAYTFPQ